jgi:fructokinase
METQEDPGGSESGARAGEGLPRRVLVFGELLWDLLPTGPVLGGAPANFAFRAQSLGLEARLVTRVGRDALGLRAIESLAGLGLDTSGVQLDDSRPTGTVPITLLPDGRHEFEILPDVAYDRIEATPQALRWATEADALCFGTLAQREATSRESLAAILAASPSALVVLDVNLRRGCYTAETLRSSLQHAAVVKLSEEEAAEVAREIPGASPAIPELCAAACRSFRITTCVVTLGNRGAFAATSGGEAVYVPGHRVSVADTIGSGDAFTAGFVAALLGGASLREACERGNALGAIVASQRGATEAVRQEAVDALMASGSPRAVDPSLARFLRP